MKLLRVVCPLVAAVISASFAAALLVSPARAQATAGTGVVTGRVLNQSTGQYLRTASVSIAGTSLATVSEAGGQFVLSGVPAGAVKLIVSYEGLDTAEIALSVAPGQTITRDVDLTSKAYAAGNIIRMGEFVVATEREGNAKAIQEQREAINFKQVMASDAFGDVSEGNIGEFLKLMPGISIDYVEADARSISVGGLDPKYTTVMMDGAPLASAGSSDLGTGRVTELEQLSVASIETIELNRTPTPEVSGSALAGVVNLRSKGAFDRKGRQVRFQTSFAANSLDLTTARTPGPDNKRRYKIQPTATLEFSDVFLGGKLGVLAVTTTRGPSPSRKPSPTLGPSTPIPTTTRPRFRASTASRCATRPSPPSAATTTRASTTRSARTCGSGAASTSTPTRRSSTAATSASLSAATSTTRPASPPRSSTRRSNTRSTARPPRAAPRSATTRAAARPTSTAPPRP
ncbi:MAG: carboxypeptidase-like regulatory domain-containing protein [Verrucomicrobia bacterium]|nr:carboxypeptidase-like regulatory domain-containing protein [Verrucomicrobiota bacterium]